MSEAVVYRATTTETAASNGIVANKGGVVYVHKVVVDAIDSASTCMVAMYEDINSSAATALRIRLNATTATSAERDFDPPVPFKKFLSTTLTGGSCVVYIHYSW